MASLSDTPLPSLQKINVVWLDVNTLLGNSPKPDLLPNNSAINNSLYNLFRCPIGARGAIFQPEYGASLINLLHEPFDYITANKIRMVSIQAIQRWEPRIELDMTTTKVVADFANAAFHVQIGYVLVSTQEYGLASFFLSLN